MTKQEEIQQKSIELQKEFAMKVDELCKEYGYMLQANIQIVSAPAKPVVEQAQEAVDNAEEKEEVKEESKELNENE